MSEALYPYYESELHFIRRSAQEFARKYPDAAARLRLDPGGSADPHVERLIEAFALLAARVQLKLHDEFPELTDALLSVLYPHALAPFPSAAVVQFTLDPARAAPDGVTIPAGSPLHTARAGDLPCRYRTCYPVALWPVAVAEAELRPPPFPPGLCPPARAAAALRLRLRVAGGLTFEALRLDRLRLHLLGENTLTAPLYDLLFNHALEVAFAVPGRPPAAVLPAAEALRPVGFEPDEGMLPYPACVFPGYRLLTEYFAYQPKFLFADLAGWDRARAALGPAQAVDVVVFLDRSHPRLEQVVGPRMFRPGCTPVVNLFEQTAEPIPVGHTRAEYPVVPDVGHPTRYEVFSVTSVTGAGAGADREYRPFYQFRHGGGREDPGAAFWYATRRPPAAADDRGSDLYLHLVDPAFDPAAASGETVLVRTLCTNRDLPARLPQTGGEVRFEAAFAAPGATVRCVRNPTPSLRPPGRRGRYWHLVSHLSLNHLSLTADGAGLEALKGLLRLYDLTDPAADPRDAALARQAVDGVVGVSSRRTTARVGAGDLAGFVRGLEVELELDPDRFVGTSGFLFASVLERFLGLYVSVNSFTRLVARYRHAGGELRRWPPRAGERHLA